MAKILLLTGDKGVGKTTIVESVIRLVGVEHFAGFTAAEQRSDGERYGFEVVMLDGDKGRLASVKSASKLRVGGLNSDGIPRYGIDLDFLESVAVPKLLAAATGRRVIVIDEIGPMQLYSEVFKSAVLQLTERECVMFGTIVERSHPWADELKQRGDVETFTVTRQNRQTLRDMFVLYFRSLAIAD